MTESRRAPPAVSVVLATYNRPGALRLAIESVRRQSFEDWELLVVGDACRDDTAAVVAAFDDPRLRYFNLVRNYGEQSGPNNVGIARARGRYIAFLNHDDLWFPDHLRAGIDWLEATGAALVFPLTATILPASREDLDNHLWQVYFNGFGRHGRYDPMVTFAPASSWLLRRETADRIGPWRSARDCIAETSGDYLFRAWRAGLDLRALPWVSVLAFHSGQRDGSYVEQDDHEQAWFWERLRADPDFRTQLLARAIKPGYPTIPWLLRAIFTGLARLGLRPADLLYRARGHGRGHYIDHLRRKRGLATLPSTHAGVREIQSAEVALSEPYRLGHEVSFRAGGTAPRHQAYGWSAPEPWGTWAVGAEAGLLIRLPDRHEADLILEVRAHAYLDDQRPRQKVEVFAGGERIGEWLFTASDNDGPRALRIPASAIGRGNDLAIAFRMPDARSPTRAGFASKRRRPGLGVQSLRIESASGRREIPA